VRVFGAGADALGYHVHVTDLGRRRRCPRRLAAAVRHVVHEPQPAAARTSREKHAVSLTERDNRLALYFALFWGLGYFWGI